MRVVIVGGGIAGAMLAWRIHAIAPRTEVFVYAGQRVDASAVSGGLMRGFEVDARLCRDAADSLAEIYADARLRRWSGYREIGSVYTLARADLPADALLDIVRHRLPGSLTVRPAATTGLRGLPDDAVAVVETRAGYLSPSRLRAEVLTDLATSGVTIVRADVPPFAIGAADITVLAAGAWTPSVLARAGLPTGAGSAGGGMRVKAIQYAICPAVAMRKAFVDDTCGLYGRPYGRDRHLLGLACDRWDVEPDAVPVEERLTARMVEVAGERFGRSIAPETVNAVASADCYPRPPGLDLRRVTTGVFTFTGGSGGAAKTVLAASRRAARSLLDAIPGGA